MEVFLNSSMTPSLAIGFIFYDEKPQAIIRSMSSVYPYVDKIYAIDGIFPGFNDSRNNPLSDKMTRIVLKSISKIENDPRLKLIDYPASQVNKRDRYLREAEKDNIDVLIVMDADEFIQVNVKKGYNPLSHDDNLRAWNNFKLKAKEILEDTEPPFFNVYSMVEEYGPGQFQDNPRVVIRPGQCEYFYHHNWVRNRNKGWRETPRSSFSDDLILRGDNSLRTPAREAKMDDYEIYQSRCDEEFT